MSLRRISLWLISSLLLLTVPARALAQTRTLVIGGKGTPWGQVVEEWIALDDTIAPGAIQTRELKPGENIVGKDNINIFGFKWYNAKGEPGGYVLHPLETKLGLNPRFWKRESIWADPRLIDGDESTYPAVSHAVPREEYNALLTATYSGAEMGYTVLDWEAFTMDMGIVVPVNRIRFFPPQHGRDRWGGLYKNDAPQAYEVSIALHPQDYLLLKKEETYVAPDWILHSLDKVLERTLSNSESIVEITFPPELLRFIRIKLNLMPQIYTLAEIEVYGEGFPPVSRYTSEVINFGKPVNFGRIFYRFTKFRKTPEGELIEDADAPVSLSLETKSGLDDSPWAYHLIGELGEEKEVTKNEYRLAPEPKEGFSGSAGSKVPRFGTQASITKDRENWDARSSPYMQSGNEIQSSDGRQYLQFMFSIESDDIFATGRLDSVVFEYSPLLVKRVVGEVSLLDEPNPSAGVVEIPAGVDTTFSYDIKAEFDASDQSGFDGISIDVPPETEFLRLEMGDPLSEVKEDSVVVEKKNLIVYFPSHKVTMAENKPVRVTFKTTILSSNTYFTGNIFDTESDNLPQSIDPGDANPEISVNQIRIFALGPSLDILSSVEVFPRIITPNGDQRNDQAQISFKILQVEQASVVIEIYDMSGRKIKGVLSESKGKGNHSEQWDGKDDQGTLVPPGTYICKVAAHTGKGIVEETRSLSVVY